MIFEDVEGFEANLGFVTGKTGPHLARSLMQKDLFAYLEYLNEHPNKSYYESVVEDNCLNKSTLNNRKLTTKHLDLMYGLSECLKVTIGLKYFLGFEKENPALVALLCALSRDPILRSTATFILEYREGERILRTDMERFIDRMDRGRYSPAMLKSLAQNINGSWTFAGYLKGRAEKVRTKVNATPAAVAYAAYLSLLTGNSGLNALRSDYMRLLECNESEALGLLHEASRMGIVVVNKVGQIMEIAFPRLGESR